MTTAGRWLLLATIAGATWGCTGSGTSASCAGPRIEPSPSAVGGAVRTFTIRGQGFATDCRDTNVPRTISPMHSIRIRFEQGTRTIDYGSVDAQTERGVFTYHVALPPWAMPGPAAVLAIYGTNGTARTSVIVSPVPEPAPDSTVTTSAPMQCPESVPAAVAVHQRDGTQGAMVPDDPRELLACRYHGFNQPQPSGSLASSASFDPTETARELNGARPEPARPVNCPADFGETISLIFRYTGESHLVVAIHTSGCRTATNGDRAVFAPSATLTRLQAVLGADVR